MSHVPHELAEEFPDHTDTITRLKVSDAHFARLAARYHEVNRQIHRAETNVEPCSDMHDLELRRERIALKDGIAGLLVKELA